MNNKHPFSSPNLKHYNSTIKLPSKQTTSLHIQKILAKILNNKFAQALDQCSLYGLKELQKITILCQELYSIKKVLRLEIKQIKQNKAMSTISAREPFEPCLALATKYKQSWIHHKKYFQEIYTSIKQLILQPSFDSKLMSGGSECLKKIKESLFTVSQYISKLKRQLAKFKEQNQGILLQKNTHLGKDVIILNKVIARQKQQFNAKIDSARKILRQKNREIQALKKQKLELESNMKVEIQAKTQLLSKAQIQIKELKQNCKELRLLNQKLEGQLTYHQQQLQAIFKKNKEYESYKKEWLLQKKNYKDELKSKNQTINSLISDLQVNNSMVADLQLEQNGNNNLIQQLTAKVHELESKCQTLNNQISQNFVNYQTQTSNFSQQMSDLHFQKQKLASQLNLQNKEKIILAVRVEEIQMQLEKCKQQNRTLQEQIKFLDLENDKLIQQINHLTYELQKRNQEYLQSETQVQQLMLNRPRFSIECIDEGVNTLLSLDDLNLIQSKIVEDQQTIKLYEQKITALNQSLQQMQLSKDEENRKYLQLQGLYLKIIKDIDLSTIQRKDLFFVGKILGQQPEGRQYLQSVIQRAQRKTIRKTVLLYQLDSLNKVNIHKYIDNVPNIVLLIKTFAGWLVAGYSEGPFYSKMISNKNGLIISISGRECFGLKVANKRAIAYDDFFVIFGNSEIRIKSQEFKLFSNFAISSSYYDFRDQKVEMITGQKGVREVSIQHVQVFQVEFY